MSSGYLVPTLAGIAFGFGMASVVYLGVFIRAMKRLHKDNVEAAALLMSYQVEGVQKVEEQNMTALTARLNHIEEAALQERKRLREAVEAQKKLGVLSDEAAKALLREVDNGF